MRMMIVGGAGFLGSHLVDRLLAEQHAVDVVDDLSTGTLANLASARATGGELKIHHLSVCADEFASLVALRSPDVVFHLACLPPGRCDATALGRAVEGTVRVIDAAHQHGVAKVVVALPAVALYGDVPQRELPVKEGRAWSPTGSVGIVARSVAELLVLARAQLALEFTILALGSVYGPRQRPDGGVVAAFLAARAAGEAPVVVGDGRQARDFVFIDDVVDALVRAVGRGGGLAVNVGTGVLTSVRDLWAAIGGPDGATPRTVPAPAEMVGRLALSATRARIHLAWAPWTTLDAGLRSMGA